MIRRIVALALVLPALATAAPVDQCQALAALAGDIAESKAAGVPRVSVESNLLAQFRYDTEQQRDQSAMTLRMLRVVYELDEKPAGVRHIIYLKCKTGELALKKS